MESIYILIPISIILAFVIGYFFWWSGKSGQFDDLEGPGHRILMDDDQVHRQQTNQTDARHTDSDSDPDPTPRP